MVSSLLNKLANYTNLSQGVVEHEEAEDSRRRQAKVPQPSPAPRQGCPPPPDPLEPPPFASQSRDLSCCHLPGSLISEGLPLGASPKMRPALRGFCAETLGRFRKPSLPSCAQCVGEIGTRAGGSWPLSPGHPGACARG